MQAALDDAALLQQRADAHEVDAPRAQQLCLLLLREAQRQLRTCRLSEHEQNVGTCPPSEVTACPTEQTRKSAMRAQACPKERHPCTANTASLAAGDRHWGMAAKRLTCLLSPCSHC
jgi:hypothetical protein